MLIALAQIAVSVSLFVNEKWRAKREIRSDFSRSSDNTLPLVNRHFVSGLPRDFYSILSSISTVHLVYGENTQRKENSSKYHKMSTSIKKNSFPQFFKKVFFYCVLVFKLDFKKSNLCWIIINEILKINQMLTFSMMLNKS